jgi:hypothetical protein
MEPPEIGGTNPADEGGGTCSANTLLLHGEGGKVVYEGDRPDDDRVQLTLQIKY